MPKAPAKTEKKQSARKKKATTVVTPSRAVVYPEIKVQVCERSRGEGLTAEQARELLGWTEETDDVKFGGDFDLRDEHGRKVRLMNNGRNRQFRGAIARSYQSEILQDHWQLNGETLIVGEYGTTISCQHRLVALVLAAQAWSKEPDRWPAWTEEPTLDCIVVCGIKEDDRVINTIDTGIPRTLADVIFRSELFAAYKSSDRAKISRIADYAVRQLYHRTGAGIDAFSPRRTHADSLDFLARHNRLLECVKHVYEEDGDDRTIGRFIPPGYAAAAMYLMASSGTDPHDYRSMDTPDETVLDWSRYEQAADFWVAVGNDDKEVRALREALGRMMNETDEDGEPVTVSLAEKLALLCKAWECFLDKGRVMKEALHLEYVEEDDVRRLAECPTVGGIDRGDPKDSDAETIEEQAPAEEGPEPAPAPKTRGKKTKQAPFKIGQVVWVKDSDDDVWDGTLEELIPEEETARVKATGNKVVYEALISQLHHEEPR